LLPPWDETAAASTPAEDFQRHNFYPKILRIGGKSSTMSGATLGCPALQVPMPPEAPT